MAVLRRGRLAVLLVTALLAVACAERASETAPTAPPSRTGGAPGPPVELSGDRYAVRLLDLANRERSRRGLAPLRAARCAQDPAQRQVERIAREGTLRHQPLRDVLRACDARRAGENLGTGQATPEDLLRAWMASSRHRSNLLASHFTHVGLAAARSAAGRWYAVAVFVAF